MTLRFPDDARWPALFAPVSTVLTRALERLDPRPEILPPLIAGTPGVLVEVQPDGIALDPSLVDPTEGNRHPVDAAWIARMPEEVHGLALDRWRRAAGAVLEGVALAATPEAGLPEDDGLRKDPSAPHWWRAACAAEAADLAAPELGLLWPALADWLATPERGVDDDAYRGAWFVRWRRVTAGPMWIVHEPETWLAFGAWLYEHAAPSAPLPLPVASAAPGPWSAAPQSFRRVRVTAGPAGARVTTEGVAVRAGEDAGEPVRLPAGERATVLVGSLPGGEASVDVAPAGPVGTWVLRAGRRAERVGAARGMELTLNADGTADVTMADAFIGPASEDALDLASRYGVSGLLVGTWRLVGFVGEDSVIELGAVRPEAVTVHPRGRRGFAMPAGPMLGAAKGWLDRTAGTRWRVRLAEDGIEAIGSDLGATLTLIFGRV
jgi:hypothetical protein